MKDNLGYVHVYCGDGKGKTTTAMGLCTRAAGYGYKVLIYQFMKNNKTSERKVLQQIPNITFVDGLEQEKFSFQMTISEKLERAENAAADKSEPAEKVVESAEKGVAAEPQSALSKMKSFVRKAVDCCIE